MVSMNSQMVMMSFYMQGIQFRIMSQPDLYGNVSFFSSSSSANVHAVPVREPTLWDIQFGRVLLDVCLYISTLISVFFTRTHVLRSNTLISM